MYGKEFQLSYLHSSSVRESSTILFGYDALIPLQETDPPFPRNTLHMVRVLYRYETFIVTWSPPMNQPQREANHKMGVKQVIERVSPLDRRPMAQYLQRKSFTLIRAIHECFQDFWTAFHPSAPEAPTRQRPHPHPAECMVAPNRENRSSTLRSHRLNSTRVFT